jgi:nucleoside-diphosphate-sugar epimerase
MRDQELHVIFGTGPLGTTLSRKLLDDGHRVRIVSRSGKNPLGAEVEGLEAIAANGADFGSAKRAASGAKVVYNCTNVPYHRWPQELPPLFGGILDAAAAVGARLVMADSLYAYGPEFHTMREDTPYRAGGVKGKLRAKLVCDALESHRQGMLEVAIAMGSDFFGPHVVGAHLGKQTMSWVVQGKTAYVMGNVDMPHTWTYVPDFVESLKILGERPEAVGRTWHVPSVKPMSAREFLFEAYRIAGTSGVVRGLPYPVVYTVGIFSPFLRGLRETFYQFNQPFEADSSDFERTFGVSPTPLEISLHETVDWVRGELAPTQKAGAKSVLVA